MSRTGRACIAGAVIFALASCTAPNPATQGSAAIRLRPVSAPLSEPILRRTVYVPVYSSIALGDPRQQTVVLSATVSVRNVSSKHRVVLESVRYFDSSGKHVRDHLAAPSELPALATVEFVVLRTDVTGGPGANFLIRWAGPADVDEPLIEAVMVGQVSNAGISFTSPGRVVKNDP